MTAGGCGIYALLGFVVIKGFLASAGTGERGSGGMDHVILLTRVYLGVRDSGH